MAKSDQDQLLDIYTLHAELADRVSQRREGANRIYVSLHVGLVVFLAALLRFGLGDAPERLVLGAIGGVGALLSVSWFVGFRLLLGYATPKRRYARPYNRTEPIT